VERVLADIDAYHGDLTRCSAGHGVLLETGPLVSIARRWGGTRPDHPISGPQATMFVNLDAEARVAGPSLQSFTDDKGRATVSRGLRSAATPQIISIMAARTISAEPNR
jgi:hypothetical protein